MSLTPAPAAEQFLTEAALILAQSLDYEATVRRLAQLAVPRFADWCFVDLLTEEGDAFDRVAVGYHRADGDALASALKRRYTLQADRPHGVALAMLERRPQLLREVGDELQQIARDDAHRRALSDLGAQSWVIAPLLAQGRAIGAVSLISSTRNFDDGDLSLVTQLAHSAASAIDNARLFAAERRARIGVTKLQEITSALSQASTAQEVAEAACRIGTEAMNGLSGALWLARIDRSLTLADSFGIPAQHLQTFREIAAEASGIPAIEVLRTNEAIWVETEDDYRRIAPEVFALAQANGRVAAYCAIPISLNGRVGGVMVFAHAIDHVYDATDRAFYRTLAQHCSQALDRARLLDLERTLLESERRANARLRLLAKVGEALSSSLELDATLKTLAKLVVPQLADWCAVDLVEGSAIRRIATENRDPEKVRIALERGARFQPRVGDGSAIANVIAQGRSHFHAHVKPQVLEAAARDADELDALRREQLVSAIVVPLIARGQCIGALSLTTSDSGRIYDQADVDFAEELGRRAGMAIANASMHHEVDAAHDRMRRLFMQAPMSIAIFQGPDHRIEFANPTYLSTRARSENIVGLPYAEAFPDAAQTGLAILDDAYRTGLPNASPEARVVIDRGSGPETLFFHYSLVALRDERGQVERLMSVSFDVTEGVVARRALDAERSRLRLVFKQAPFPIGVFEGPEHRIVFANEKWEALVGRPLPAGLKLADAVPELVEQNILALHDRAFAGETVVGREVPLQLIVDGRPRAHYFHVVLHPLLDESGKIEGHVTMALDVTEQALIRSEVESARREAETANNAKDEFLAMLGHELRNPLAPIMTALNLMELRGVSGAERELNVIARQVRHLTRLVDDLLDVSRIIRGKVELVRQVVELSEVVARALEMASPLFEERNLHLRVAVPRDGLAVHVDAARLAQALSNLLMNAAKYTDPGGHVSIAAKRVSTDVVIEVADDGIGIRADMLDRIFELFVQEQQALDRARGGLGLGLSIVKSIATMHGGSVSAQSDGGGRGSVFSVRLPASTAPVHIPDGERARSPNSGTRTRRVLVVDDNEDAGDLLALALQTAGHSTRTAVDGPSALRLLEDFPAQVALLDIGLPAMDGYELASRINSRHPQVRLIAVTGYGQESDRERARAAGFQHHLVKPVDIQRVLSAIQEQNAES